MFDDVRRIGEKIDNVLGTDIFPFNYPFSYTENFLQSMEKWEFAIPNKFLWLVNIDPVIDPTVKREQTSLHPIPKYIGSSAMWNSEPAGNGQHAGSVDAPGAQGPEWNIDQGKGEITRDRYLRTGGGEHGCILAQGVVLPGERYEIGDATLTNNMGFLPGKYGGNRMAMQPLTLQWRETNRSFVDLVIRPWLILASHIGLAARPPLDGRQIKCNISVVQLAKTYQYIPLVERKIWRFYNCVPTSIDSKELTYQDGNNFDFFTTEWHYSHYSIESLPNKDMNEYMNKEGFKKFIKDMAVKLLSKNKSFQKLQNKLAKVEEFVDKAANIKKKVDKVLGFLGGGGRQRFQQQGPRQAGLGRTATGSFESDQ